MREYLWNAWSGWRSFTDSGKLAVLFVALTVYLLMGGKRKGAQKCLVVYGAVAGLLCIFPVSAMLLMIYQTPFYDYPWIWSIVPFTAVIALGGVMFLTDFWRKGSSYRTYFYNILLTLLVAGVLVLCGGLGINRIDAEKERQNREYAQAVLAEAFGDSLEGSADGGVCLWAPQEILEYARVENSRLCLLYGRNMWNLALNAYSYDSYSQDQIDLYEWMEHLTDYDVSIDDAEGQEYVQKAFSMGADCILLPVEMQGWIPTETVWQKDNVEVERLERYYLLKMR